ncbi:MAG: MTH1187 family thiamine-binding protein, partial [Thermoproteota archaeon]|nr:MTH1187 family thiamine-binding protein [Thermoproteota archaeon]
IYILDMFIMDMTTESHKVVAEISITPIGKNQMADEIQTSMSKEIASAVDAIKKLKEVKVTLTAMGTELEANNIQDVLKSVEVAHQAVRDLGIKRIISTIRIDERFDKKETLEDGVNSVNEKLA